MKTTIVCGLLGSGKTTFIRNYLRASGEKVVVLVNDFGKAGIDGEILSAGGIESIELPSGCVCCTLKFDMITTLEKVTKQFAPEHIVIEPSGVASPSGVLEILDAAKISPVQVIGIVDATEFLELAESGMYGRFFEDQIRNSDVILVNKVDLVDDATTQKTMRTVDEMNPHAVVYRTVNAEITEWVDNVIPRERVRVETPSHLRFDTLSLRLDGSRSVDFWKRLFEEMAEGRYGNIVRAKALVQTDRGPYRFDLSFGTTSRSPFPRDVTASRLVLIGDALQGEDISSALSPAPSA